MAVEQWRAATPEGVLLVQQGEHAAQMGLQVAMVATPVVASMVPGVGELMDAYTLQDASASVLDRVTSTVSLAASALPFVPNAGALRLALRMPDRVASLLPAMTAQLRAAALVVDRGGTSPAARALQSHASRPGSWTSGLGGTTNASRNAAAQMAIDDILANGTATFRNTRAQGAVIDVRLPDGAGAQWRSDGSFVGILERYGGAR